MLGRYHMRYYIGQGRTFVSKSSKQYILLEYDGQREERENDKPDELGILPRNIAVC